MMMMMLMTMSMKLLAIRNIRLSKILVYLMTLMIFLVNGLFTDYTENTELIQYISGHNITLQCNIKGIIEPNNLADTKILWYFKHCGENSGSSFINCYNTRDNNDSDDWKLLPCENQKCKTELNLKNVTESYSGLYKCKVMPVFNHEEKLEEATVPIIQFVRTFRLDIKNSSLNEPQFLDEFPLNKTISYGSQAVFQCRVSSDEYPSIKWFRRLTNLKFYALNNYATPHSLVYYNGQAYELLNSAREKHLGQDVYLSKLILNDVQEYDQGYYACVAISYSGHSIREAYLQVYDLESETDTSLEEYWSDYSWESTKNEALNHTDPREFLLLFLMPIGLALLPLSVWLIYITYKRCGAASTGRSKVRRPMSLGGHSENEGGTVSAADHQRMLRV